ncbi:MAG: NAD(P)H-hydrate epimerase [archaeon]|nr:NAD(P)H-hydrate epimerase [archaeon]
MISVEEMKKTDEHAQTVLGIPALILMETAGANAARIMHERFNLEEKNVTVFCGTGNNGGDGLVFARHAAKYGASVSIVMVKPEKYIRTSESKTNYNIARNLGINVYVGNVPESLLNTDIAIDAMLGIGILDDVKEPYAGMIDIFNKLNCTKVSLDCPSGINADTGRICKTAVKPDITITFHEIKKGLNQSNCGEIVVTDIGINKEAGKIGD